MPKKLIAICILLAPALVSAQEIPNRQVALKKGDRILFFGDSLTYLAGKDEPPKQGVTKGYVKLVQESLDQSHPDLGVKVDWVATGGPALFGYSTEQGVGAFAENVVVDKHLWVLLLGWPADKRCLCCSHKKAACKLRTSKSSPTWLKQKVSPRRPS